MGVIFSLSINNQDATTYRNLGYSLEYIGKITEVI
jgi:hypothetical protein